MSNRVKVVKLAGRPDLVLRWTDPVTGAQRQKTAETANHRTADRKAADLESEIAAGKYADGSKITWDDFRTRYEEEHLAGLAKKTWLSAATALNHLEKLVSPKNLSDITPAALSTFASKLRNRADRPADDELDELKPKPKRKAKKKLKRPSETTIASYLGHIQASLGWARDIGLLKEVPRLPRPKRAKRPDSFARGRAISTEEFERMLAAVPKVRPEDADAWTRFLRGLWLSGLRLGESMVLTWDDDDSISVDLSGKRPRFRILSEHEKGKRDRLLPMTPDFATFLLETPVDQREGRVFKIDGLQTREPITPKRVGRTVSEIGRKAKVVVNKDAGKYASAHDLRRSFGSRWAVRVTPAVLQRLMRHETIETTMKFYVGLDADRLADDLWKSWGDVEEDVYADKGMRPNSRRR
jgi:integrase